MVAHVVGQFIDAATPPGRHGRDDAPPGDVGNPHAAVAVAVAGPDLAAVDDDHAIGTAPVRRTASGKACDAPEDAQRGHVDQVHACVRAVC